MVLGCSFEPSAVPNPLDAASTLDSATTDAQDPLDPDGDGVVTGEDNCPFTANPEQENEDSDLQGNACDLCPHLTNDAVDSDSDSDGVGDACDPQPGLANTWLYFEGFDTPLDDDDWVGEADFNVSGGLLSSNDNVGRYSLRYEGLDHGEKVVVGARMSYANPLGPNGVSFRFGGPVVREGDPLGSNNGCWVLRALNQAIEGYAFVESTVDINATVFTELAIPDVPFNIEVTVDGTNYFCLFAPDGVASTQLESATSANLGRNRIGVVSSFVETRVEYLFAISMQ